MSALEHRGEHALTLTRGSNGTEEALEFTYRLTLSGAAQVTSDISKEQARLVSESEILLAIASGQIHLGILIHLLFRGIEGQHGVRRFEDAAELLPGNSLMEIQKVVLRAYTEVAGMLFTEDDLALIEQLREPAGKAAVSVDGTSGEKSSA